MKRSYDSSMTPPPSPHPPTTHPHLPIQEEKQQHDNWPYLIYKDFKDKGLVMVL